MRILADEDAQLCGRDPDGNLKLHVIPRPVLASWMFVYALSRSVTLQPSSKKPRLMTKTNSPSAERAVPVMPGVEMQVSGLITKSAVPSTPSTDKIYGLGAAITMPTRSVLFA